MKFSEFPYKRPDYEKVMSEITALTEKFKAATSAKEQLSIMKELEQIEIETFTASTIARFLSTRTFNTRPVLPLSSPAFT